MSMNLWIRIDEAGRPSVVSMEKEPSLEQMQEAVGGLIEYCTFGKNVQLPVPHPETGKMVLADVIDVIAHEEGRLVAEPIRNALGTYAAFGRPISEAPYSIVGAVIVHFRITDDAQETSQAELMNRVLGVRINESHMMPSMHLDEADYTMKED